MNYGVFLDEYSSILALDRLLEKGEVGKLECLKTVETAKPQEHDEALGPHEHIEKLESSQFCVV